MTVGCFPVPVQGRTPTLLDRLDPTVQLPGVREVFIPLRSTLQRPPTISIRPMALTPARDPLYQEEGPEARQEQAAQPMKLVQTIILQRTFLLIP